MSSGTVTKTVLFHRAHFDTTRNGSLLLDAQQLLVALLTLCLHGRSVRKVLYNSTCSACPTSQALRLLEVQKSLLSRLVFLTSDQ